MQKNTISLVISTFQEENNQLFLQTLKRNRQLDSIQTLCVDGGSSDKTQDIIKEHGGTLYVLPGSNRAERLNFGIEKSNGDIILLYHPRSYIETSGLQFLVNHDITSWGAFTHKFVSDSILLKLSSFYSNYIRFRFKKIAYLDHGIFFPVSFKSRIKIPSIPIFEDTELSKQLNACSKPGWLLEHICHVSAIRFEKNGFWRQFLINQTLKVGYWFGISTDKIYDWYEKNLNLNG